LLPRHFTPRSVPQAHHRNWKELKSGNAVATLDYIVFAVLIAGLVVAVMINVRSYK